MFDKRKPYTLSRRFNKINNKKKQVSKVNKLLPKETTKKKKTINCSYSLYSYRQHKQYSIKYLNAKKAFMNRILNFCINIFLVLFDCVSVSLSHHNILKAISSFI